MTALRSHRCLFVCLLGLISLLPVIRAHAQSDAVPDTLDWRRYFPLDVGNEWQYRSEDLGFVHFTQWLVRNDTLIDGKQYYNMDVSGYDGDRQLQAANTWQVRYDTIHANVVVRSQTVDGTFIDDWLQEIPCGLDAPFQARHECTGTLTGMDYSIDGIYNTSFLLGTDRVETAALKFFDSLGGGWILAADIGLVVSIVEDSNPITGLVFASVAGKRYGEAAVPTSSEPVPEIPAGLAISSIYPSPFTTTATLAYHVQLPGHLSVEIYNVLGQRVRVYSEAPGSAGSYQTVIDGSDLSAGTYFIRLVAASGGQDTRTITLIK